MKEYLCLDGPLLGMVVAYAFVVYGDRFTVSYILLRLKYATLSSCQVTEALVLHNMNYQCICINYTIMTAGV